MNLDPKILASGPPLRRPTRAAPLSTSKTAPTAPDPTPQPRPATSLPQPRPGTSVPQPRTTIPGTPFRSDQVAVFSNDLLTESSSGIDESLFDEPIRVDPPSTVVPLQVQSSKPLPTNCDPRRSVADPRTINEPIVPSDPRMVASVSSSSDPSISAKGSKNCD